jgi:F-type H+-transporting ATPase subunit gamma
VTEFARIEARLESLGQLGELVGALRSMAASRAREAQAALNGTEAFRATVNRAISSLFTCDVSPPPGENGKPVLVVITSENGFVGGFNTRIMERVRDLKDAEEALFLIGRRGQIWAREFNLSVDQAMPMTSRADGVTQLARRISARLVGMSRVRIIFALHQKNGAFDVHDKDVLPLMPALIGDDLAKEPLHHLPTTELLEQLASEYLFAEIAQACMESLVSEHSARLITMDSASRNIDERFENLRQRERIARQEQTTADMLDVIVGSEAVNHG